MSIVKSTTLTTLTIVALLGVTACSDPGANVPEPGQGTGGVNASQPVSERSTGAVETTAPAGGAAARIGDVQTTVENVACTVHNGQWTMSGGDDEGAKVAVTATEDRATVQSASVVLSDGTLASMSGDSGSATISWEGETFTLTGSGQVLNLNSPAESDEGADEQEFVITASCDN